MKAKLIRAVSSVLILVLCSFPVLAKTVSYNLVITRNPINLSGKKTVDFSLMVNGGIPAPTLEFTEGDDAEITVKNEIDLDDLKNHSSSDSHSDHAGEEVSIHWHGILLPPEEDGVPHVNTPPIFRGQSRTFKFKIRQSGTYWYHSHTMLQEQKGVFGAIVIHPKKRRIQVDHEAVVVLSDWSDENADNILKNIKKDGDYYLYKKNTVRSYWGAISENSLGNFLGNEWIRMGGMDLSDVGYDAFLINGKRESQLIKATRNQSVRLRIINAASSSYFRVSLADLPVQVVSADGIDVKPIWTKEILMGMAETYDIVFKLPESRNYELRASAQDGTGFASTWIGGGEKLFAKEMSKPDLYASMDHGNMDHGNMDHGNMDHGNMDHGNMDHGNMDHGNMDHGNMDHGNMDHGNMNHGNMNHGNMNHGNMNHGNMEDSEEASHTEVLERATVDSLRALAPTEFNGAKKIHDVKLVLGGDMRRYVWHLNGKTIRDDRFIDIKKGEVVRFTYENQTMMHHPMHLHGHFFRVVGKQEKFSPLKHTVDVPPMGTRVIEFYSDEPGRWMLHCHNLYHMESGMARVVNYVDFQPTQEMKVHENSDPHRADPWFMYGRFEVFSNHAEGFLRTSQSWNQIEARYEVANIKGKNFSFDDKWDYEGDLFYRRWWGNWGNLIVGGTSYAEHQYGVAGIGYTLPFLVETNSLINHEGKFRFDLSRKFQWTSKILSEVKFTWRPASQGGAHEVEIETSLLYVPVWAWSFGVLATNDSVGVGAGYQF